MSWKWPLSKHLSNEIIYLKTKRAIVQQFSWNVILIILNNFLILLWKHLRLWSSFSHINMHIAQFERQSNNNLTRYYKTGNSGWQNKWNRNLSTVFRIEVIVVDFVFSKSIYLRISMDLYVHKRHHLFPVLL